MLTNYRDWRRKFREDFASSFPNSKRTWVSIEKSHIIEDPDLAQQIFDLIDDAYKGIGGNANIRSKHDLTSEFLKGDLSVVKAIDLDDDSDPDAVIGYKRTDKGNKAVLSAAKGSSEEAKKLLIDKKKEEFNKGDAYGEVSGPLAKKLIDATVPVIEDEETVRSMLPGKNIIWHGEHPELATLPPKIAATFGKHKGWYTRLIGGHPHTKLMIGLRNKPGQVTEIGD
jgi:hypothetical protein